MTTVINFYTNNSEPNRVDKDLKEAETFTGDFRAACSALDPVFRVDTNNTPQLLKSNYCYIPVFGRYYFIKNITFIASTIWEVSCHVDVLSTYKDQLRALSGVCARQEKLFNLYLNDDRFKVYQDPDIFTKAFPKGFDTQAFVLAIAGG